MMKTVITYGTFDIFHIGHLKLIQRLSRMGDNLIIGVSTDEFNAEKGKRCIIPFEQRKEIVENIKGVDLVIAENNWGQKERDIKEYGVDLFVMGDDWQGKFDHLTEYCTVEYISRTEGISTTYLKNILREPTEKIRHEVEEIFKLVDTIRKNLS